MSYRYGIVGIGTISWVHFKGIERVGGLIAALCELRPEAVREAAQKYGCPVYTDYREMIDKEKPDVVVVLTQHYSHPEISIYALKAGCHVLCEKPIAVSVSQGEELAKVASSTERIFGVNYMTRNRPDVQEVKKILQSGDLGKVWSVHYVNNNWLRGAAYYGKGGWRGTWSGEGGGVLTNQSPHDLDRIIYLFGSPESVVALAGTTPFHKELMVEDYADALLYYPDGMRLIFSTATHLHPGVDRLEIWGERGYLKLEQGKLNLAKLPRALPDWDDRNEDMFGAPEVSRSEHAFEIPSFEEMHARSHDNFLAAIEGRARVNTTVLEGLRSVELANAIVLGGFEKNRISLPLDGADYERFLERMITAEGNRVADRS